MSDFVPIISVPSVEKSDLENFKKDLEKKFGNSDFILTGLDVKVTEFRGVYFVSYNQLYGSQDGAVKRLKADLEKFAEDGKFSKNFVLCKDPYSIIVARSPREIKSERARQMEEKAKKKLRKKPGIWKKF